MALPEKHLVVKRSSLPGSGKGLFTKKFIAKGIRIVEYKGKVTSWQNANQDEGRNRYLFYYNRSHVIDASTYKKAVARFANDAHGIVRVKGLRNNSKYVKDKMRVYIEATRDIPAGEEILVEYGKEYWDQIRANVVSR